MPSSRSDHKVRSVRASSSLEGRGDEWLGLGALCPVSLTAERHPKQCSACILQHIGVALSWHLSEASRQGSSEWDSLVRREAAWGLVPGKRRVGEACRNSFIFHAHLPGIFWLLMPGRQDVASECIHAHIHILRSREGDRTLFPLVGAESWGWGRKGN